MLDKFVTVWAAIVFGLIALVMQAENCNSAQLRLALLQFFACITRAINSKYYSTPSYYIYKY